MDVEYILADPTGNITALVLSAVPAPERARCASAIMQALPECQQVGYVRFSGETPELQMMGGEFCGNASLCCAALLAEKSDAEKLEARLRVSGTPEPVSVWIRRIGDHWEGSVQMPCPLSVSERNMDGRKAGLVELPGISHLIFEEALARKYVQTQIRLWNAELGAAALGVLQLDLKNHLLTPTVYVPSTDTVVWESSCASGTAAAGAWLSWKRGKSCNEKFREPGGVLEIEAERESGAVSRLLLSGSVHFLEHAVLSLDLPTESRK